MKSIRIKIALFIVSLFATIAMATPATAQATRTWISGVGDDVNPCSRTAPCKTFQGAISKTATGGEINCLDSGGFGGVTITKSISLVCDNTETGVLVASTNAIIVNAANAIVLISGFDIEGLGQTGSPGINGVNAINVGTLTVMNSKIRGFRNGAGIQFASSSANARLFVLNTQISENGSLFDGSGAGVRVAPTGTGNVIVSLDNVAMNNNAGAGLLVDTSDSTGAATRVNVRNSTVNGNANGISVVSPSGRPVALLSTSGSAISGNTGAGLLANGGTAQIRATGSVITANGTGIQSTNGGFIVSYGDNVVFANIAAGAFNPVAPIGKQ